MGISEYAKSKGISYKTVYRWFKDGRLPSNIKGEQTPSGTIILTEVKEEKEDLDKNIVIYCRVSSYEKKDDLLRQVERCKDYCIARGYQVTKIYKEVASGMNDNRKQLYKLFDGEPDVIVIEHKDRLTRFGFNYIKYFLEKSNSKIEILNPDINDENDLIKDLISIITSFCCRLYGLRKGKKKADGIKNNIMDKNG